MTTAHAFLAPSSASRWVRCAGSAWMESQFPDLTPEEDRKAGTAAHWVLEWLLIHGTLVAEGVLAPNGVPVSVEMRQGAELAARVVEDALRPVFGDAWRQQLRVEQRVHIRRVHATHNWGTPDLRVWAALPDGRFILWVFDYKFGMDPVEVFENWQLVDYAAGCLDEGHAVLPNFREDVLEVHLCVLQPRAYHHEGPVRWWRTTAQKLVPLIQRLELAAEDATGQFPQCTPHPDACTHCRARYGCDALAAVSWRGMEVAKQAVPRDMSDAHAGLELAMLQDYAKLMKARMTGIEELVKSRIQRGGTVPHWAFEPGQARTTWAKPVDEVLAMGRMIGLDIAKPTEPITPLQAMAKGLPEEVVLGAGYAKREPGAVKLTRQDGSEARKVFG